MAGNLDESFLPPPPEVVYEPLKPNINAMEVFLLLLCLYSGVNAVFTGPYVNAVDYLLGPEWAFFWAIALIGGALLALIGVFWRGRAIVAIAFQEIGYAAFGIASIARGVALILISREVESIIIFGFAIAAFIRILQLEHRVRRSIKTPGWLSRLRGHHA